MLSGHLYPSFLLDARLLSITPLRVIHKHSCLPLLSGRLRSLRILCPTSLPAGDGSRWSVFSHSLTTEQFISFLLPLRRVLFRLFFATATCLFHGACPAPCRRPTFTPSGLEVGEGGFVCLTRHGDRSTAPYTFAMVNAYTLTPAPGGLRPLLRRFPSCAGGRMAAFSWVLPFLGGPRWIPLAYIGLSVVTAMVQETPHVGRASDMVRVGLYPWRQHAESALVSVVTDGQPLKCLLHCPWTGPQGVFQGGSDLTVARMHQRFDGALLADASLMPVWPSPNFYRLTLVPNLMAPRIVCVLVHYEQAVSRNCFAQAHYVWRFSLHAAVCS